MKVKRITIGLKSWEENKKDLKSTFRQIGKGKPIPEEETLTFTDLETFRKCLTPKRLALLWTITEHQPQSVRELASLVRREAKNVSEDLDYLCQVGLVELRPSTAHGNARAPVVPYDRVDVSLDLRRRAA